MSDNDDIAPLNLMRSIETQTDVTVEVKVRQIICNINPPALAAVGILPYISKLPMSHYIREHVIVENTGNIDKRSTPYFFVEIKDSGVMKDDSSQTDIVGEDFYCAYRRYDTQAGEGTDFNGNQNISNANTALVTVNKNVPPVVVDNHMANNQYYYRMPIFKLCYNCPPMNSNQNLTFQYQNQTQMNNRLHVRPVNMNNQAQICPVNMNYQQDYITNMNMQQNGGQIIGELSNLSLQEAPKPSPNSASQHNDSKNMSTRNLYNICVFCRSNRESRSVYTSHQLRGRITADGRMPIECPVLRKYVCKICSATGDDAHTESHCPQNDRKGLSVAKLVTNTPYNSSGNKRSNN